MNIRSDWFVDCICGQTIGIMNGNVFHENKNCKRLYVIGGILLIACLVCGRVYIDPALVKEFRSKNQTKSQGE